MEKHDVAAWLGCKYCASLCRPERYYLTDLGQEISLKCDHLCIGFLSAGSDMVVSGSVAVSMVAAPLSSSVFLGL